MTKLITCTAAIQFPEKGAYGLDDDIRRYLYESRAGIFSMSARQLFL